MTVTAPTRNTAPPSRHGDDTPTSVTESSPVTPWFFAKSRHGDDVPPSVTGVSRAPGDGTGTGTGTDADVGVVGRSAPARRGASTPSRGAWSYA